MTLDEIIKMLKADDYIELTPEESNEIVEYLEYYKEQDSVIKMYKAVYCDKQSKVNELEKELGVYTKALELACYKLSEYGFCGRCGVERCKEQGCYRSILSSYLQKAREE